MATIALRDTCRKKETNNLDHSLTKKNPTLMALISEISASQGRQMGRGVGAAGLRAPFPGSLEIQRLSCPVTQQQENICSLKGRRCASSRWRPVHWEGGREAAGGSTDVCLRQDAASLLVALW